jgi:enoyl-CoA hydratase
VAQLIAEFSEQAMEMILTGTPISGMEMARYGLANAALPAEEVLPKALELASTIAAMSRPIAGLAKAAILKGGFDLLC